MPDRDAVERYLAELDSRLRLGADERRRVVAEMRAHFEDAIAAEVGRGAEAEAATAAVLARAGSPRQVAAGYPTARPLLDLVVLLGAIACAAVAAWLLVVTATVLQRQDPAHVNAWRLVAIAFAAYATVTVAYLRLRWRSRLATFMAAIGSVAAVVVGAWFTIPMLLTAGDFEGYIVLIGGVLFGQGILVIASALLSGGRPTPGLR